MNNPITIKPSIVWVVEDDQTQSDTLGQAFQKLFPSWEVVTIPTEKKFSECILKLDAEKLFPDLVVCDVMLPFQFCNTEDESQVQSKHDMRTAGVRCWKSLRKTEKLMKRPKARFIYYTIVDEKDFNYSKHRDTATTYLSKERSLKEVLDVLQTPLKLKSRGKKVLSLQHRKKSI